MEGNIGTDTTESRVDLSTAEGIEKLSNRIRIAYNRLTKRAGDPDDCVQEILCRMLEGKHQHSTINQCVIDYLRVESGRKGSPGYTTRLNLKYAASIEPGGNEPATRVDYAGELHSRRIIDSVKECDGGVLKEVLAMRLEGRDLKQIGEAVELTESRASQLLKEATEKMQVLAPLPEDVRKWAMKYVL